MSVQETVWKYLRSKGVSENSTAAIMGNIQQESEFNPDEVEVGGDGFGLIQWSYDRKIQLKAYGTDLIHQLEFFWSELTGENTSVTGAEYQWHENNKYLSHSEFMAGSGSVDRLAEAFCACFERANAQLANLSNRITWANKYYSQFTGTIADSANSNSEQLTIEATNYQVVKGSEKYGDVLFGRRYRITVTDKSGNGIDVSELRCTFNIVKTIQMQPNTSEISIYNLNAQTENAIIMSGKRVTVEAGYEGSQFGLIFDGDIYQTLRGRENGNTFKLTIIALDSDRAINFDIANYSIVRGQTARDVVEYIANSAKNPINLGSISDKLKNDTLTRGVVLFGKSSDYIRQIAKTYDLHYYMDDGRLNLISMDELPDGEIIELSPSSGLIGIPEQSEYGINGQCLLNPQIKLNTLIHIDNRLVREKRIDVNGSNSVPIGTAGDDKTVVSGGINGTRDRILAEAKKLCDDPNVQYSQENGYRGQTVNGITYYDCSLFAKHCYEVAGLDLLDVTTNQWSQCLAKGLTNISLEAALPGDLVFWFTDGVSSHVAIYDGKNGIYAARGRDGIPAAEQVEHESLYGDYKIARPQSLISADGGELPSAINDISSSSDKVQTLYRGLDKDGIYRVIAITYEGDTRGDQWYLNFQTVDQIGGVITAISN